MGMLYGTTELMLRPTRIIVDLARQRAAHKVNEK
jgi:hypothetical protein